MNFSEFPHIGRSLLQLLISHFGHIEFFSYSSINLLILSGVVWTCIPFVFLQTTTHVSCESVWVVRENNVVKKSLKTYNHTGKKWCRLEFARRVNLSRLTRNSGCMSWKSRYLQPDLLLTINSPCHRSASLAGKISLKNNYFLRA